jgi:hypothetical protein
MADPTFVMVRLPTYPGMGFSKPDALQASQPRTFALGLPAKEQTLTHGGFDKTQALIDSGQPRTFAFGLPAKERRLSPFSFVKTQARLNGAQLRSFAFFYPSNGTVPGSPIPRSGQVAPRPV